jgi:hypothetical protein
MVRKLRASEILYIRKNSFGFYSKTNNETLFKNSPIFIINRLLNCKY